MAKRIGIVLVLFLSGLVVSTPPSRASADLTWFRAEFVGTNDVGLYVEPAYDPADPGRIFNRLYREGVQLAEFHGPDVFRYLDSGLDNGRTYEYEVRLFVRDAHPPNPLGSSSFLSATLGQVRGTLYDRSVTLSGVWSLTGNLWLIRSNVTIAAGAVVTSAYSSYTPYEIALFETSNLVVQAASLKGSFYINMRDNQANNDTVGTITVDGATLDRVVIGLPMSGYSHPIAAYGKYSIRNSTLIDSLVMQGIGIPLAFEDNRGSCSAGNPLLPDGSHFSFRNRSIAGQTLNIRNNELPGCRLAAIWDAAPASVTIENNTLAYIGAYPASAQATSDMYGPVTIRNNALTGQINVSNLASPLTIQGNSAEAIDLSNIEDVAPAGEEGQSSPAVTPTRVVKDNTLTPQDAPYPMGTGVRLNDVSGATVEANQIDCGPRLGKRGISAGGSDNWLSENTIRNCGYGIEVVTGSGNHVVGNTITSTVGGQDARLIYLFRLDTKNYVERNTLTCLYGNWSAALYLYEAANIDILGNNARNCQDGLVIYGSSSITAENHLVRGNLFISNTNSARLIGMVKNNRFTNNQFRKAPGQNSVNVAWSQPSDCGGGTPCANVWSDPKTPGVNIVGGPFLGGNYWNDYSGPDADGDRLGDTPFPVIKGDNSGANVDYLPLFAGGRAQKTAAPAAPQSVYPGQTIRYQVGLSWEGQGAANFTLNDALPWPRLDFVPNSLAWGSYLSGCQYNAGNRSITCTGAFPASGLSTQMSFDAKATCDLYAYGATGDVVNSAAVQIGSSSPGPTASTGVKVPFLLKSSSPAFLPQSAFPTGQTLLLYSVPKGDETSQSLACRYDLHLVVNGNTANPIRLQNDAAGLGSRSNADFYADDPHYSLWFKPTANAAYTLQLYVMSAGQQFAPLYLADTLTIQPSATPKLVALTDLRELFREFERTSPRSAGQDSNNNLIRDYYDVLDRLRQYAADHRGVVLDVRQDAYTQDYNYSSAGVRPLMGANIDLHLIRPLGNLARSPRYVAIVGDDAVVPFYRRLDLSGRESSYLPQTHQVEAVEDLQRNFMLTDLPYGTFDLETLSDLRPRPYMAVGRVFRSQPLALSYAFDDYERPLLLNPGSGSAFVFNVANDAKIDFQANTRVADVLPLQAGGYITATRFVTDLGAPYRLGWLDAQAGYTWNAGDIGRALKALKNNRLTVLNAHGSHLYFQTPVDWFFGSSFGGTLSTGWAFLNQSCHGGFSTGYDKVVSGYDYYRDALALAALDSGVTYFGATNYSYTTGGTSMRYHDLVFHDVIANLLNPAVRTTGQAYNNAIWRYYRAYDPGNLTETDLLGLYGTALYGLPTQPIRHTAGGTATASYSVEPIAPLIPAPESSVGAPALAAVAITISLEAPNFRITADQAGRLLFEVPNGGGLTAEGTGPLLPLLSRSFDLPAGARGLTATLVSSDTTPYPGAVQLAWQTAGSRTFGVETLPFTGTATYPERQFWTSVYTDEQRTEMALSAIPLRFEPLSGQVTLFNRMDFRIEYELPSSAVRIDRVSVNGGSPVAAGAPVFPVSTTVVASDVQPLTLFWRFEDRGGGTLGSGTLVFTPTLGASVLTWPAASLGWPPGPAVLHVLVEDANEVAVAAGQAPFIAQGTRLTISTDRGVYGGLEASLTLRAEIRDQTGAALSGLAGSLSQTLDVVGLPLVWQEGNGYTATVSLAGLADGQHNLQVSLPGGWSGEASFGVDRTPPTSTITSPARVYTPTFTLRLSGGDAVSGVDTFLVQYRLGEDGAWTDWITRTVVHDYTQTGSDNLAVTFGPTLPVPVTRGATYYFRVRATDRLGNQEGAHAAPDAAVIYDIHQVFVPLVMRAQP